MLTAAGSYYFGIFLSTAAYVHPSVRGAGQDLIRDSYTVVANLFIYDLILYASVAISPNMRPLYDEMMAVCERAVSTGNAIQLVLVGAIITAGIIVILSAFARLSWLALLVIYKILKDAADVAALEGNLWAPICYVSGIVTMMNMGAAAFAQFIFDNWLLLAALGVFLRILPFDLGERAGRGLFAFAVLNYLLLPFYPVFRDVAALFLTESYPLAAYFPATYVLLDGVALGVYVAFIQWLVGGVALVSFGLGGLIPALGATQIIATTRRMIQQGAAVVEQAAELMADQIRTVQDARTQMNQRIEGCRAEILALPPGNEHAKENLLRRLDGLKAEVEAASPFDILQNKDDMVRKINFEVSRIEKTIETIFYEPKEVTLEDVREVSEADQWIESLVLDATTPTKSVGTAGPEGRIEIMAQPGVEKDALEAIETINALPPSEHLTLTSIQRMTMSSMKAKKISGYGGPDFPIGGFMAPVPGKADIVIYRQETTEELRRVVLHEVGHVVHRDVDPTVEQEWRQLHNRLGWEIANTTRYAPTLKDADEAFAESYAHYHRGADLPSDVRFFFDQSHTWKRGMYKGPHR